MIANKFNSDLGHHRFFLIKSQLPPPRKLTPTFTSPMLKETANPHHYLPHLLHTNESLPAATATFSPKHTPQPLTPQLPSSNLHSPLLSSFIFLFFFVKPSQRILLDHQTTTSKHLNCPKTRSKQTPPRFLAPHPRQQPASQPASHHRQTPVT